MTDQPELPALPTIIPFALRITHVVISFRLLMFLV